MAQFSDCALGGELRVDINNEGSLSDIPTWVG